MNLNKCIYKNKHCSSSVNRPFEIAPKNYVYLFDWKNGAKTEWAKNDEKQLQRVNGKGRNSKCTKTIESKSSKDQEIRNRFTRHGVASDPPGYQFHRQDPSSSSLAICVSLLLVLLFWSMHSSRQLMKNCLFFGKKSQQKEHTSAFVVIF